MDVKNKSHLAKYNLFTVIDRKMAIGLIGVSLSLLLVIQGVDVLAQQILTNASLNTTSNTTTSNNSTVSSAFDQLKDTFGSLFGK